MRKRETNIELLRVVSMFIIVINHYVVNDVTLAVREMLPVGFNKIVLQFFQFGGGLGVNIFVLISGYFLSMQMKPIDEKIIKTVFDTTVYSVGIYSIAAVLGYKVSLVTFIKAFFPIVYPVWWFVTAYVLLLLASKYLNEFIHAVDKVTLDSLIFILTIVLSVLPTIMYSDMEDSNVLWFILLYLIGARIRLYSFGKEKLKKYSLLFGITLFIVTQFSSVVFDCFGKFVPFLLNHAVYFSKRTSFPILMSAILIFYGVLNLKVIYSETINRIASTTFGIYLIHMHPAVQNVIWSKVFQNPRFAETPFLLVHAIGSVILVFVISSFLSYIYNLTVGKGTFILSKKVSMLYANLRTNRGEK